MYIFSSGFYFRHSVFNLSKLAQWLMENQICLWQHITTKEQFVNYFLQFANIKVKMTKSHDKMAQIKTENIERKYNLNK